MRGMSSRGRGQQHRLYGVGALPVGWCLYVLWRSQNFLAGLIQSQESKTKAPMHPSRILGWHHVEQR